MGLGLAGVVLLSLGGELKAERASALILLSAPVSWALASLLSQKLPLPKGPVSAATEMLTGGVALVAVGLARGEVWPAHPDPKALASVAYLVVFGSLVGFTAFNYLLRQTRPAVALSYAYVNPLVAVMLSVAFDTQVLTGQMALATVLIIGATAFGILSRATAPATPPAPEEAWASGAPRTTRSSPAGE